MSNPYGDTEQGDERPQPRYGAYGPRPEASSDPSQEQPSPGDQPPHGGQHNPYGQPSWGQPGSDAGAHGASGPSSPYGDAPSWGHPGGSQPDWQQAPQSMPVAYPNSAAVRRPKRPTTMILAMVLMLVAAGLSLIWGIYVLITVQTLDAGELMSEQMRETMVTSFQNDPQLQDLTPEEAMQMMLQGLGLFALFWGLVLTAIYSTLAFVGTMTGNVGRVLATIWLVGSLLFLLLGHDGASRILIGLTVLASIGALILLWLPASNDFVRQRRAFKEAQQRSSYSGYAGPPPGHGGQPGSSGSGPYGGPNPYGN